MDLQIDWSFICAADKAWQFQNIHAFSHSSTYHSVFRHNHTLNNGPAGWICFPR